MTGKEVADNSGITAAVIPLLGIRMAFADAALPSHPVHFSTVTPAFSSTAHPSHLRSKSDLPAAAIEQCPDWGGSAIGGGGHGLHHRLRSCLWNRALLIFLL